MKCTLCRSLALIMLASAGVIFPACGGSQSAVSAVGEQSRQLEFLWWVFFWVCTAVYLIVMAVLAIAFFRRQRARADTPPETMPDPGRERTIGNAVKAAIAVTLLVMLTLMALSFRTGRSVSQVATAPYPLSIRVKGQQWWWEVEYRFETPSDNVTTANEIHVPTGRPIKLLLESTDVIHSFWLPNLHGKKDLIPGYPTEFSFVADTPGTYWGQCAEYCGTQHAKMRFVVTVETPEQFDAWLTAQRQLAPPPVTETQMRGQQIFLTSVCAQCHAINGTPANGRVGPDLTHIASRPYIAAGSLQNNEEHLQRWITDPHQFKPGIRMPMNTYSDEDLRALTEYLRSLR